MRRPDLAASVDTRSTTWRRWVEHDCCHPESLGEEPEAEAVGQDVPEVGGGAVERGFPTLDQARPARRGARTRGAVQGVSVAGFVERGEV